MGAERALTVVGLQALLMTGVRDHLAEAEAVALRRRVFATAASLDYVLMLVTDSAGARIPAEAARHAEHAGFARAVDDALALLRAILDRERSDDARAFVRGGLDTVRAAIDNEGLTDDERAFALIALASDLGR